MRKATKCLKEKSKKIASPSILSFDGRGPVPTIIDGAFETGGKGTIVKIQLRLHRGFLVLFSILPISFCFVGLGKLSGGDYLHGSLFSLCPWPMAYLFLMFNFWSGWKESKEKIIKVIADPDERKRLLQEQHNPTWGCKSCGEKIEEQFDSCWKCGKQRI